MPSFAAAFATIPGLLLFLFAAERTVAKEPLNDSSVSVPPPLKDSLAVVRWLNEYHVPGMVIGVMDSGRLKQVYSYGYVAGKRPMTPGTLFNVASITKTATALVSLRLWDQGLWHPDSPLYRFWTDPDIADHDFGRKLTTRHVLSHQTGFPNWRRNDKDGKLAFSFEPGTGYGYSGEGYEYLRRALEIYTGKSLGQLAEELLFKPLALKETRYVWKPSDIGNLAAPHDSAGYPIDIHLPRQANGADLMLTNVYDLAHILRVVLDDSLLSARSRKEMHQRQTMIKRGQYTGLGCFIYSPLQDGSYALSHGGDDPGVHSIFFLLPEPGKGLIIHTNGDNGPKLYGHILSILLPVHARAIIDIEMSQP